MDKIKQAVNANTFSSNVERLSIRRGCSVIEAVLLYCEENEIEIDAVQPLCNERLREKLKANAMDLNMLKIKKPKVRV